MSPPRQQSRYTTWLECHPISEQHPNQYGYQWLSAIGSGLIVLGSRNVSANDAATRTHTRHDKSAEPNKASD